MTRWPWITISTAAVALASPPGQDLFHAAFLSGEQLSRNIAGPLYLTGVAILIGLVLAEWLIRSLIARRRAARLQSGPSMPGQGKMET